MQDKTILIVGGAGFIGSYVNKLLLSKNYKTVILDNLSTGHEETLVGGDFLFGDLGDRTILTKIFNCYSIDAVMHFAAFTSVGESVSHPSKYYNNNVVKTLTLLDSMVDHQINHFIFSSSAAIFGLPQLEGAITEEHPCHPINPYGESKWMIEKVLHDYSQAYDLRSCCLRYFNAAAGDPEGIIPTFPKKENNLIPLALETLLFSDKILTIFGEDYPTHDGTCIRDYIHIHDLASAHLQALQRLLAGEKSTAYNLGNGKGFSVREVVETINQVTGKKVSTLLGSRREGDPPYLVADSSKALKELSWEPQYSSLETMISHAWEAMKSVAKIAKKV